VIRFSIKVSLKVISWKVQIKIPRWYTHDAWENFWYLANIRKDPKKKFVKNFEKTQNKQFYEQNGHQPWKKYIYIYKQFEDNKKSMNDFKKNL